MMDGKSITSEPVAVSEIKAIAKTKLQGQVWDYYTTGADEEETVKRNEEIYQRLLIRPFILRRVAHVGTSTTVFGKRYNIPIAIAPSAYQKLVGNGGETDIARASVALGTNFTLSSNSTVSMEDVMAALPPKSDPDSPRPWFQLYFLRSRDITAKLIRRAETAGYEALVLTVDTPILGNRYHQRKEPLVLPEELKMANIESFKAGGVSKASLLLNAKTAAEYNALLAEHSDVLVDADLEWHEVIPWLRSQTQMKIILKGVLTAEDAARSVEAGVDAIVVSNHGGRQLDSIPSTLEALPEIVGAIKGRIPIIFDGGISKGTDVFKALALGADLCLIGRTALWGLAYDGQKGVETVLHILERELSRAMALAGAKSVHEISRLMLGVPRRDGFGLARL
ncbi:alpha-hydroxy acid oxidase [Aspergillus affinis]|uniref:alpha-hydroxy acid oxidase n=1 Tax=Aspergillus affinis TaxID=1070780 RepID=UPI0022FEC9D1|nr:fmn-dependent dehydrogenase [Aspergillus affinis]KAI9037193.1 fmn-dependent dehydrogenase [Aspergillus affinis]